MQPYSNQNIQLTTVYIRIMPDENNINSQTKIELTVGLNEDKMPVHIDWFIKGSPDTPAPIPCKAMLLSLFDKEQKDTFRIDLWTEEMQVVEMDRFMFQTLRGLADTYFKSTKNTTLANDMQRFVNYFGEKTGILNPEQ